MACTALPGTSIAWTASQQQVVVESCCCAPVDGETEFNFRIMTVSEAARRIVASAMLGDSVAPATSLFDGKLAFSRFEAVLLCTCAGSLLEHKLLVLALRFKRLLGWGTLLWLPSVFILDILVFAMVYVFLTAPSRWHLRTRIAGVTSRALATVLATFTVLVCCTSMVLLMETGRISFEPR